MNTTVPDKRNAPTLVIFWDPVGLILPLSPLPRSQKALCGTIKNLNSRCQLTGGYETVPGEIRGRLLKISYGAYTKKRASRCGTQLVRSSLDSSRSLTKKIYLFVAAVDWVHWNEVWHKFLFRYHHGIPLTTDWVKIIIISKIITKIRKSPSTTYPSTCSISHSHITLVRNASLWFNF